MTARDEDYVPPPQDQGHGLAVWALFLAGPVIWFTHFIVVYALAEVLCKPASTDAQVGGLPLISFITIVATVLAAIAAAVATVLAFRRREAIRTAAGSASAPDEVAAVRGQSLATAGFFLGMLFTVAVVFTGAPALVLRPC